MDLSQLKPGKGSNRKKKIVGRGNGSRGSFSGGGMNGQRSRSGGSKGAGFEGGQMPLHRRLPKRGFSHKIFKKLYTVINVGAINRYDTDKIDAEFLYSVGIISKKDERIKLLADGEILKPVKIMVHKASKKAIEKVIKAGGTVEVLEK